MPGLVLRSTTRPAFNAGTKTLTFDVVGCNALKGQLLIAIAAYDPADSFAAPAGWTSLVAYAGTAKIAVLARMVDDNEPDALVLALTLATHDWLGSLALYTPGSPVVALEASAGDDFAASATPPAPDVACQQAINLRLGVWSCSGAPVLAAPAGWTQIDSYSTAIAAARSVLVAQVIASATGALGVIDCTSGAAATGSAISVVLRDRFPIKPATLDEPLPGNIGLFGKDTRPPREAGLP